MSWHPADLVTDTDLKDYERDIQKSFGQTSWAAKRTKAIEDWLLPAMKARGLDPLKFRTRRDPVKVWGYTSAAYTDKTSDASSTTEDDVNLATILAASTDYLYIGLESPFRGLHARMLEAVSTVAATLTLQYWGDGWVTLPHVDGTAKTSGKPFSGGGTLLWTLPTDWQVRKVNGSDPLFWVRLALSSAPTGAKAVQLGCVRVSVFRAPTALRTLQLIMREAPTGADGPWLEKAEFYKDEADAALTRALDSCGGEFDTDNSDQVSATEAAQTVEEVGGFTGLTLERG